MGVLGKSSTLRTSKVPHFGLSICGTVGLKKGSTVPHFYYSPQLFHTSTTYTEDNNHTKLVRKRGVAPEPRCVSPPPLLFAATHRKAPPSENRDGEKNFGEKCRCKNSDLCIYSTPLRGECALRTGATPPLFLQYPCSEAKRKGEVTKERSLEAKR
jgi:hypothetical protein